MMPQFRTYFSLGIFAFWFSIREPEGGVTSYLIKGNTYIGGYDPHIQITDKNDYYYAVFRFIQEITSFEYTLRFYDRDTGFEKVENIDKLRKNHTLEYFNAIKTTIL